VSVRRERIDALLEHVKPELEALGTEAMDEIAQAEREANAKERRYHEAVEERAGVEKEISAIRTERESLPDQAYRAGMDEDYELEDTLKERYKNLRLALEALEDQQGSLKREIGELLPQPRGHELDAHIKATTSATGAAFAARKDMEHLKDSLTKALASAADPVVKEHAELLAEAQQLNRDREWALSPAGMGHRYVPLKQ